MPSNSFLAAAAAVLALAVPASAGAATSDYAGQAYSILAPGQWGGLPTNANSTDQAKLYDALTPLRGNVSAADLRRYFKSERFGVQGAVVRRESTGRAGLKILRDRFDVPHIYGRTRADVAFGAGWVAAQDRGLLLQLGLGPAYAATLDIPGVNAFALVTSGRSFTPSPYARRFVANQLRVLNRYGATGRKIKADFQAWVDGVNAYRRRNIPAAQRPPVASIVDAVAAYSFIGSIFGNGGGAEVRNAAFLASLRAKFGAAEGLRIFRDFREVNDPEAAVSIPGPFPYNSVPRGATPGSPAVDAGSISASAARAAAATVAGHRRASNALLVGAPASRTGRSLFVAGPQLGYFYPEIVLEADLHGGGIDARGAMPPTMPYILLGRGKDYSWSLTSADNDNTDQFLEQLCVPGGGTPTRETRSYLYKGTCRAMQRVDAGTLGAGGGQPARELTFYETVHGPVGGTVTVGGRPYAVATRRATRGREPASARFFVDLNENKVTGPQSFFDTASKLETTFNVHYADDRNIAYFSSGLLPKRAPGVDPSLPTLGTGRYDWRGWLSAEAHPHGANPEGTWRILNWNNKPARDWGAADSNWGQGSVQRVQLFRGFPARSRLNDVASVMNRAATQDLRTVFNWPVIARVLARGTAPSPLARQAADLITAWGRRGAARLDTNLDGKIDDPGAAVMDAAYDRIARAVLGGVLGDQLTSDFADLNGISNDANPGGSSYGGGWYSYVDKDLRTLLGDRVAGRYHRRYCGAGSLPACSQALWAAIQQAADGLAAAQGPSPAAWRADATAERIRFGPGLISDTMRWTNRPTFQQAVEWAGHRPARR